MPLSRLSRFGSFELDLATGELRKSGVRIKLQEQPFQVLRALVERPGEVVTREELRERLWPGDTFVEFDDGLNTAVRKIRQALGDSADNPRFVETLPRRGYRFIAPVQTEQLGGVKQPGRYKSLRSAQSMIGSTISHYKITEKLGEGGMGVVYKAEDTKLKRPVALKFLAPHLLKDEDARKRFEREARAAAGLDHPNICTVYEIDDVEGNTFIALAYLEGDELTKCISEGPLKVERLLDVAIQLARGLQEAHGKGVVHRDIKPANVMDTSGGQAVLMDFGLAQLTSAASKLTQEGTRAGTSSYMSPEQTTGAPVDHRTDIWALGVVLYEMATGELPFKGHYEQAVLYSILNEAPQPVTALREGVPPELEQVINKCLAKRVEGRYQTVSDLLADLNALKNRVESGAGRKPSWGAKDMRPSIAVLPFENRSRGDEDEYFSDGISEDITGALAKVEELQVTPRSLAFQFKGKRPLPEEVGRTLNVQHVLEGSVRRSGDRVRIHVELIAIDEQFQLWSERYDRVMEDIFEVQDDISQSIVEQLKVKLVGAKKEALGKRYTENVQAYNLCLRGRHYWYQRTAETLHKAVESYEQALAEDPNYALAYSGLADCYSSLAFYGVLSVKVAGPKAEAAALKALQIDTDLAAAHVSVAAVKGLFDWDWSAAEREFQRAIELDSTYPVAHLWYGVWVLLPLGRMEEAFAEFSLAMELDPVTPTINFIPGYTLVLQGQHDRAIEHLQNCMELDPNFFWTHFAMGMAYLHKGDYDQAIAAFHRGNVPQFRDGYLGCAYAVSGETNKARQMIEALQAGSQPEHFAPFHLAIIHLGLGEKEEALECLIQACDLRSPQFTVIHMAAEFDSVRADPRFQAILRRMNLAD